MQVGHYEVKELGEKPNNCHLANVKNTQKDEISVVNVIGGCEKVDDKTSALDETDDVVNECRNYENGKVNLRKANDVHTVKGSIDRVSAFFSSWDINENDKENNAVNIVRVASLNESEDKNIEIVKDDYGSSMVNHLGKRSKNHKEYMDSGDKVAEEQLSFKFHNNNDIDNTEVLLSTKSNHVNDSVVDVILERKIEEDRVQICNTELKDMLASASYYYENKPLKNVSDVFTSEKHKYEFNKKVVNNSHNQSSQFANIKSETHVPQIDTSNKENSAMDHFDRKEEEVKKFSSLRLNKLVSRKMRIQEDLELTQKISNHITNTNVDKTDQSLSNEKEFNEYFNINDSARQELDFKINNMECLDTENVIKSKLLRRKLECIRKKSRDPI